MDALLEFFSNDYMPHGHCYLWLPSILWVNVVSDLLIALAYFSIPIILIMIIRARTDIKFKGIFILFAAFILMCGISHLMAIYTIWNGSYGWHGVSKMITAIVSVLTATALLINRKAFLSIPTATQLELALAKAETANQAKRDFLACMSHEIRTPINGVMGMLNLALANEKDVDQARKLGIAQESAASLLAVINDIIDFSKVEAGKLDVEKVPFNIGELLSETIKTFSFSVCNKNLELLLDSRNIDVDYIVGDPGRIRQVLSNLISNAVKFTAQGEIRVIAEVSLNSSGTYEFKCCVKDTGIGIPSDKIEMLFTPFTQADSSTTREYGGTGLGLAICSQLANLMGGDIKIESEVGLGSQFSLTIPTEIPATDHSATDKFSVAKFYATDHSNESVLLVSANPFATPLYCGYLSKANYRFVCCAALADIVKLKPEIATSIDVVLIDASLANNDGVEVLLGFERLYPQLRGLWFIDYATDARFTSKDLRFTGYIEKPLSPAGLFNAISMVDTKMPIKTERNINLSENQYPINILIVEDHEINQAVIEGMLENCVEAFSIAEHGADALNMLKNTESEGVRKYDLVFMDCQMPIMDGYEATRKIRAGEAGDLNKNIYIIAMTANAMDGDKEQCLAAGMDGYLTKPIDFEEVVSVIDKHYRRISSDSE